MTIKVIKPKADFVIEYQPIKAALKKDRRSFFQIDHPFAPKLLANKKGHITVVISESLPYSDECILGIDQSLTNTAFCILWKRKLYVYRAAFNSTTWIRTLFIRDMLREILEKYPVDCVMMEGYGFGARSNTLSALCELAGVLVSEIFEKKIPLMWASPTAVKFAFCGNGIASKEIMMATFQNRYGFGGFDDNDCDAAAIAIIATEHRLRPIHPNPDLREGIHKSIRYLFGAPKRVMRDNEIASFVSAPVIKKAAKKSRKFRKRKEKSVLLGK